MPEKLTISDKRKALTAKQKLKLCFWALLLLAVFLLGTWCSAGCMATVKGVTKDTGNGLTFAGHFLQDVSDGIAQPNRHE